MSGFVLRACCSNPGPWAGFIEPDDEARPALYGLTGRPGPIKEVLADAPPIDREVGLHEAGHAIIGYALGRRIVSVSIAPPAMVRFEPGGEPLTPEQRIAISFSGPAGEMTETRFYSSMSAQDKADYLQRASDFCGGQCDGCQMAYAAWQSTGFAAGVEAARAVMRAGEKLAVDFLAEHRNRLAVHHLADRLMIDHYLDGADVHKIIEEHIEFGSLRGPDQTN